MQQGALTGAYANAVQEAAKNSSGSMNGFMGIGMMNMASNGVIGGTTSGPWKNVQNTVVPNQPQEKDVSQVNSATTEESTKLNISNEWICECGTKNIGKFCSNCGKKHETNKICPKCGTVNEITSKFCKECGEKLQ